MLRFITSSGFILLLACQQLMADESMKDYCQLDKNPPDFASFQHCDHKIVQLTATMAKEVLQHPTGLHIDFNVEQKIVIERVENYVNVGSLQIVVTSNKPLECKDKVYLTGRVDMISQGGVKGTKDGYQNPWLRLQSYRCA